MLSKLKSYFDKKKKKQEAKTIIELQKTILK